METSVQCSEKTPAGAEAGAPAEARAGVFLVATENRTTGALLCRLLAGKGHSARWVARAAFEHEFKEEGGAPADLVIVEVNDEAAVAKLAAMAKEPELSERAPLIALTPPSRPDLRSACERAGFEGCLSAPIHPQVLTELVEAVLAHGETRVSGEAGAATFAIVDRRALEDLSTLGGDAFVRDIVMQFVEDGTSLLKILNEASINGDSALFRDQAHALRSCAANVGASGVYSACLALREIEPSELAAHGAEHMKHLEDEFARAREALQGYLQAA